MILCASVPILTTCAAGLDFGQLSNECALPRFDVEVVDEFCSGELSQWPTYQPSLPGGGGAIDSQQSVIDGDLIVVASTSLDQTSDADCWLVTIGLSVGTIDESGVIRELAHVDGPNIPITFRVSPEAGPAGVCDLEAGTVQVTEVAFLDTAPIRVAATYADGGFLYAELTALGDVNEQIHVASVSATPTRRVCRSGGCVLEREEACASHSDCDSLRFCNSQAFCEELNLCDEESVQCADELQCHGSYLRCAVQCTAHEDCPYPLNCNESGLCGVQRCSGGDADCPDGRVCRLGQCLSTCAGPSGCGAGLGCLSDSGARYCGREPVFAECDCDEDCALGAAYGFAVASAGSLPGVAQLIFIAAGRYGGRVMVIEADGNVTLVEGNISIGGFLGGESLRMCDGPDGRDFLTDVVFDERDRQVYGSLAYTGVARLDLSGLELAPGGLDPMGPFIDLWDGGPFELVVAELRLVDDYLVLIEGGIFVEASADGGPARESYARIMRLDSGASMLEELSRIRLGRTWAPDIAGYSGRRDLNLWLFAMDRIDGVDLSLFEVGDLTGESLVPVPLRTITLTPLAGTVEPFWPSIAGDTVLLGEALGMTPFTLQLTGEAL